MVLKHIQLVSVCVAKFWFFVILINEIVGIVAKDMRLCQLNHVEGLLRQGRTEKEKNPLPTTKAEKKKLKIV